MSRGTIDQVVEWLRLMWDMQRQDFGERLRCKREGYGLTIQEMADKIGVNHSQVTRWELGETTPKNGPTIMAIVKCYRLDAEETKEWFDICSFPALAYSNITSTIALVQNTLTTLQHRTFDRHHTEILNHLEEWSDAISENMTPLLSNELLEIESQLNDTRDFYSNFEEQRKNLLQPFVPVEWTTNFVESDYDERLFRILKQGSNLRPELRQWLAVRVLRTLVRDWKIDIWSEPKIENRSEDQDGLKPGN